MTLRLKSKRGQGTHFDDPVFESYLPVATDGRRIVIKIENSDGESVYELKTSTEFEVATFEMYSMLLTTGEFEAVAHEHEEEEEEKGDEGNGDDSDDVIDDGSAGNDDSNTNTASDADSAAEDEDDDESAEGEDGP